MKNFISWKSFFILLVLGLVSVACVFPYIVSLQGNLLAETGQPLWLIFVAQLIQTAILFAITISLGLFFTKKIGFKLPIIEGTGSLKSILAKSVIWGILAAIAIYTVDIIFTVLGATISTHQNYAPIWQKLLASVYGGTTEEIIMRLFLMTLFIWLGMKIFRKNQPGKMGIIISIVLAAVIFGLGHLPVTASLASLTPLIVVRAVVLNGIGGVIFGWLFWKKGLESAMIAHFTADIFLLTLLPLLFS